MATPIRFAPALYGKDAENFLYRQIFIPNEQNCLVSIPSDLYGREVEVLVLPISEVIISSKTKPRDNWATAARQMHQVGDDILLIPTELNNENIDWWTWEK